MERSPSPWKTSSAANEPGRRWIDDANGHGVAIAVTASGAFTKELPEAEANAAFIVRAANNHAQLLGTLETARTTIRALHGDVGWHIYERSSPEMQQINAVIESAKSES